MFKFVFIFTLLVSSQTWGQQATVYKEKETCHNYSEYYKYENYNNGQYDKKNYVKEKTTDVHERTVVEQGNNITILEKKKVYDNKGELAFTYSYNYEIERIFLEENKYKDKIEFTRTVYIGQNSQDSITHEGLKETKIYQIHHGGSIELIQHLSGDGTEYDVEENLEYSKPDGSKYKVILSEEKSVDTFEDFRMDTLFKMKVCNTERI